MKSFTVRLPFLLALIGCSLSVLFFVRTPSELLAASTPPSYLAPTPPPTSETLDTSLQVDTTTDDGARNACNDAVPTDCSLRGAIQQANLNSSRAFTIVVPAGVYQLTLTGANEDGNATGDLDVTNPIGVVLQGAGAESTLLQAGSNANNGIDRVLEVGYNGKLTLQGVTVRYGQAVNGGPGAIYSNSNAVLTILESTITANTSATTGSDRVGGIWNNGQLTLRHSTFSANNGTAGGVGALYNRRGGVTSISDSSFSGNHGVALYNEQQLTIADSTFADNQDTGGGASGLYNSGTVKVERSTFVNNSSTSIAGALFNSGTATVRNSTFSGNTAIHGGGVLNNGLLTVDNSTFSANRATQNTSGGNLFNNAGGTLHLQNTILANSAGGADCKNDGVIATNTNNLIEDNSCAPLLAGDPNLGPLQNNGGATVTYALLPGSPAIDAGDNGACLAVDQRGSARPSDGDGDGMAVCDIGAYEVSDILSIPSPTATATPTPTITNTATVAPTITPTAIPTVMGAIDLTNACAGGVGDVNVLLNALTIANADIDASTITLAPNCLYTLITSLPTITSRLTIIGNNAVIERSHASDTPAFRLIYVMGNGNLTLVSVLIRNGLVSNGIGGGILNEGLLTLTNSVVANNTANHFVGIGTGGGIANLGQLMLNNSVIRDNIAYHNGGTGGGGGLYNKGSVTLTVSSLVSNTVTGGSGGGIYNDGILTLNDCTVTGNRSEIAAGGLINAYGATLLLNRTLVAGNVASAAGGMDNYGTTTLLDSQITNNIASGGIGGGLNNARLLTLRNSTVSNNRAFGDGGGISIESGTVTLLNSTVSENTTTNVGGGFWVQSGTVMLTNSTVSGNHATSGGGIENFYSSVTLTHTTISNNTADSGGGLSNTHSGVINLINSLVALQAAGGDCRGTVVADRFNLDGDGSCDNASTAAAPYLGLLQINAPGNTATHALLAGSPAIDSGNAAVCAATDQRGVERPVDGNGDGVSICDIGAYEAPVIRAAIPDIKVSGNSLVIVTGDTTPDIADGTDFGRAAVTSDVVTHTFTIRNTGAAVLTLTGSPLVLVSGTNADDFSITALPASSVAAGDSTTFQLRFAPSAAGIRTAMITIASNDSIANPYTFAVQGVGNAVTPVAWLTNPANGHAYATLDCGTWLDCQAAVATLNDVYLVTIADQAEQDWLVQTFGGVPFWIGLTDEAQEGEWQWTNGESVTYTNWSSGEPNEGGCGEDYGVMNWEDKGRWNDLGPCGWDYMSTAILEANGVAAPSTTTSLALGRGWNLVALPVLPADGAPGPLLASLAGQYNTVYAYNGCDAVDPWKKYEPTAPFPFLNDLNRVGVGQGLWLRTTNATTLTVTGQNLANMAIPLCVGWNLISWPGEAPTAIATALDQIDGQYNLVYAYDASDPVDPWKKYDPAAPFPFLNDLHELKPGMGYWLRVTDATTLVVP